MPGDALIFCTSSQPVYFSQPGDALTFGGSVGDRLIFSGSSQPAYLAPAGDALIFGCLLPESSEAQNIQASVLLPLTGAALASWRQPLHASGRLELAGHAHASSKHSISASGLLELTAVAHASTAHRASASATLALQASASAKLLLAIHAAGSLTLNGTSYYAPSWYTPRPFIGGQGGLSLNWSPQQRLDTATRSPHRDAPRRECAVRLPHDPLPVINHATGSTWRQTPKLEQASAAPWGDLTQHPQAAIGCDYSHPDPQQVEHLSIPWGDLDDIAADIGAGWFPAPERKYRDDHIPWDDLAAVNRLLDLPYSAPPAKDVLKPIISGPYWYPRWCIWQYNPPRGDALIFNFPLVAYAPAGDQLIFADVQEAGREHICYDGTWNGPKDAYWYQPHDWELPAPPLIRSYYIIMNSVSLKRISDNTDIPIMGLTVSTDHDSWCWSLSAQLRRKTDLDLVRPTGGAPVEVEATINGNSWRFVIESYGDDRAYGQWGYSISGRSLSAYLAQPYSAPGSLLQPGTRTAAQLADEALTDSGFTTDWQLTDWLVPGGVYSVTNQTPMQQLLTIAAAAGGVVHSDPSANIISLLPWYKHLPWEWGAVAVDAILPAFKERRTSYQPQPLYTGVYTSGQAQGVMCFVRRAGTDGSAQPQMVTDALITATEAGLQRGQRILADSGPRSVESLTAPLFDDPGLLTPGMLIEVIDSGSSWRGLVTRCSIAAQRPTVTQSLDVLRYHGT